MDLFFGGLPYRLFVWRSFVLMDLLSVVWFVLYPALSLWNVYLLSDLSVVCLPGYLLLSLVEFKRGPKRIASDGTGRFETCFAWVRLERQD